MFRLVELVAEVEAGEGGRTYDRKRCGLWNPLVKERNKRLQYIMRMIVESDVCVDYCPGR